MGNHACCGSHATARFPGRVHATSFRWSGWAIGSPCWAAERLEISTGWGEIRLERCTGSRMGRRERGRWTVPEERKDAWRRRRAADWRCLHRSGIRRRVRWRAAMTSGFRRWPFADSMPCCVSLNSRAFSAPPWQPLAANRIVAPRERRLEFFLQFGQSPLESAATSEEAGHPVIPLRAPQLFGMGNHSIRPDYARREISIPDAPETSAGQASFEQERKEIKPFRGLSGMRLGWGNDDVHFFCARAQRRRVPVPILLCMGLFAIVSKPRGARP